jgi:hypothetical protein
MRLFMGDANTVAIGAPYNDESGNSAGHVRLYKWNGIAWIQKGQDIDGEAAGDYSGQGVSMPDTNTVAIGAPGNSGLISAAGHVRIFSSLSVSVELNDFDDPWALHPNPTDGPIVLELGKTYERVNVAVMNALRQNIKMQRFKNANKINLAMPESAGVYFIEVGADNQKILMQIIKQ